MGKKKLLIHFLSYNLFLIPRPCKNADRFWAMVTGLTADIVGSFSVCAAALGPLLCPPTLSTRGIWRWALGLGFGFVVGCFLFCWWLCIKFAVCCLLLILVAIVVAIVFCCCCWCCCCCCCCCCWWWWWLWLLLWLLFLVAVCCWMFWFLIVGRPCCHCLYHLVALKPSSCPHPGAHRMQALRGAFAA